MQMSVAIGMCGSYDPVTRLKPLWEPPGAELSKVRGPFSLAPVLTPLTPLTRHTDVQCQDGLTLAWHWCRCVGPRPECRLTLVTRFWCQGCRGDVWCRGPSSGIVWPKYPGIPCFFSRGLAVWRAG